MCVMFDINTYEARSSIKSFYRNYHTKHNLIGVEIGVDTGNNAETILNLFQIKMLYLIDPYIKYDGYPDLCQENAFEIASEKLKDHRDRIQFIKKKSEDAIDDIPNGLDFIYIDGNHTYEYVKKDINLYWPKLKLGGYMMGNDFSEAFPDVVKAVTEFQVNNCKHILIAHHNDWLIIRNPYEKR